jgi:hypothetical protein
MHSGDQGGDRVGAACPVVAPNRLKVATAASARRSTKASNFASGNEANFRGERLRIAQLGDNLQLFGRRVPNHHSPNRRRNLNFANANAAISSRLTSGSIISTSNV